jgi:hypothetical protein
VIDRFEALIRPRGDEVVTSRDSFMRARAEGIAPAEAKPGFAAWSRPFRERKAQLIARPAAFDWPWIVHYARTYLSENPFGFKAVCASFMVRGQRWTPSCRRRAREHLCTMWGMNCGVMFVRRPARSTAWRLPRSTMSSAGALTNATCSGR